MKQLQDEQTILNDKSRKLILVEDEIDDIQVEYTNGEDMKKEMDKIAAQYQDHELLKQ